MRIILAHHRWTNEGEVDSVKTPTPAMPWRRGAAVVLLIAAAVLLAVTISQLFGPATDPRDGLGSRAAGFGFTDTARGTLFGAVPLGLPLLAALLSDRKLVYLCATVEYVALIAIGTVIAVAAFGFGIDAGSQRESTAGTVFITSRAAVEALVIDVTMLALAAMGMVITWRAWRRARAPHAS